MGPGTGACECGCGQPTKRLTRQSPARGMKKGEFHRYVVGHHMRNRGVTHQHSDGYVMVYAPDHPRAHGHSVYEHFLVAEKALGRFLKHPEEVHHVDGNPANNTPSNLVVCPNRAYHMLLHRRQRLILQGC
jgi:hypothetical protein